jgi:prophage regulatory protein
MKSTVNSTPRLARALHSVRALRRISPQICRTSPPHHRLEFLQDAEPLAMNPNTPLPSVPSADTPRVLARLPVVLKFTGLGRSTIYRWIAEGSFPPPVRLGPRAVAWRWSDLDRWTQSRDIAQH